MSKTTDYSWAVKPLELGFTSALNPKRLDPRKYRVRVLQTSDILCLGELRMAAMPTGGLCGD